MARLLFEMQAVRTRRGPLAAGTEFVVYTDSAGTVLADISATVGGSAIPGSTVTVADIPGLGPSALQFYGPSDGTDVLYLRCPSDASLGVQEIEADVSGGGGGDVATHAADTTAVHGITDTAQVALRNATNTFSAAQIFTSTITVKQDAVYHLDGWPSVDGTGATASTAAIQAALDAAQAAGGGIVKGKRGQTYLVDQQTTKTFAVTSGSTSFGYCLEIPTNVLLDLDGATLKLKAGADAVLVCNEAVNATTDTDLGLVNAVLDGNSVTITSKALVNFYGVTRLRMDNVQIKNGTHIGFLIFNCNYAEIGALGVDGFVGQPYMIGLNGTNQALRYSHIGSIRATAIDSESEPNFPGNAFYGVLRRCTIDSIIAVGCDAGVKLDSPSSMVTIAQVVLETIGTATGNTGLKLQTCSLVNVGQVVAVSQQASGLYLEGSSDCHIASYIGYLNGQLANVPDVWVAGLRNSVGKIYSESAGQGGVLIRADAVDYQLSQVEVVNAGQVTGVASSTSSGVSVNSGSGSRGMIDQLTIRDDQGSPTMNRGLDVNGSAAIITVGQYQSIGPTYPIVLASTNALVLNPRCHATDPLYGEASPSAAATTTTVANGNVDLNGGNDPPYVRPIVEVTPLNTAARTLGTPFVTFSAGNLIFNHGAAVGTEKYRWRIIGYVAEATNPA